MFRFHYLFVLVLVGFISCQEDDPGLETLQVPTNLQVQVDVASDQSGNITVTPAADNALYFHIVFLPGQNPVVITPGESASFRFTRSGQYTAPVTVVAFSSGGLSSSTTVGVEMDVRLFIDQATLQKIAGNGSKRWVWNASEGEYPGHFGVGPVNTFFPDFFRAPANSLNPCLYDDVLVFSYDDQDNYSFAVEPGANNEVYVNWAEVKRFFPDANPGQFVDECRDIEEFVPYESNFVILDNDDGTRTLDVGSSFLSYFSVVSGKYQIIELTENRMTVRGISDPFDPREPNSLAWYFTFVPEDGGNGGEPGEDFDTLVFEEEFNVDGAPDPAVWNYDLGTGDNGWGNNESQYYTDRPENIVVEDGLLKITARAEEFQGSSYTSARIQSYQNYEFQYGRVEVRAKLPSGGGTWPAIWMLGADFETNIWPAAGEIDIMEHVGNQQNRIFGSTHDPNNFAGNSRSVSTVVEGVSDEFHIYGIVWTRDAITFTVGGRRMSHSRPS